MVSDHHALHRSVCCPPRSALACGVGHENIALTNENGYHPLMDEDEPKATRPAKSATGAEVDRSTRISSRTLLAGAREMIIEHEGREYRLRVTSQGKLILTA
jgi:hemin uptake protein HemP